VRHIARLVVVLLWVTAIFEIFGGTFVWRTPLKIAGHEDGTTEYRISLYRVQPEPLGPPQCDLATVGRLSMAMPCDMRPPFVDMAKKYL
jgi:hypothetical protein